jgi:hypothetical protein
MSTFKKHVGRIRNTDRRCVVVYMEIPGNPENALIVDTDSLPDRFHDPLMDIIDSVEGQQTNQLHTLLVRRILPGFGMDILNALHSHGFLRPVPIDNVVMYPAPNAPCPLRTIVDFIKGEGAPEADQTNLKNRILENQESQATQSQIDIASNIIRQATDLEEEAARKREQAYRMVPHLRPRAESPTQVETPVTEPTQVETFIAPEAVPSLPVEEPTDVPFVLADTEVPTVSELPAVVFEPIEGLDLPPEIAAALEATVQQFQNFELPSEAVEPEGNEVDTSDAAVQEFLDRAALREDQSDREKWEAMQPKNPVGRPRKDGQPAGTKAPEVAPAPKKRGRPPKAKVAPKGRPKA